MSLEAGRNLLHYTLVEKLGEGGMGVVWKARDTTLDRDVAIKIFPDAFAADRERLARFEREAKLLASLNHPNIAAIYGIHKDEGTHFLAMELVPGENLAQRIAQGRLPVDEALQLAGQVADALQAAHAQGVIHRDLKPANIQLTPEGDVKVLDFGLAKAMAPDVASGDVSASLSPTVTSAGTMAGVILGTAAYMAPEQARGKPVDQRADLWALGCVLYEMLSGQPPFNGETVTDMIASVVKEEPDFDLLPESTPTAVRRLLSRTFQKHPRRRLHHAGDAKLEIEDGLNRVGETDASTVVAQKPSRLGWIVAAVALALLAGSLLIPRGDTTVERPGYRFSIPQPETQSTPNRISPDGRLLAFADLGALWVRPLDADEPRRLDAQIETNSFFWSPDSKQLGYFAGGKLRRIPVDSGVSEVLCDVPVGWPIGTWSTNGNILVEVTENPGNEGFYLYRPGATEVEKLRAFPVDRATNPDKAWPEFLPDGNHYLFIEPGDEEGMLHVGSIDSETTKPLIPVGSRTVYAAPGWLVYVRNGSLLAHRFDAEALEARGDPVPLAEDVYVFASTGHASFSVSQEGTLVYRPFAGDAELTWIARDGRKLGTLMEPCTCSAPSISADGKQLLVAERNNRTGSPDLWSIDLEREIPTRLTRSPRSEFDPVLSPDGTMLAFSADWEGPPTIYIQDMESGEARKVVEFDRTPKYAESWVGNEKFVYVNNNAETDREDIHVVDIATGEIEVLVESEFWDDAPVVSADGQWMAFRSTRTGDSEVYLRRVDGRGSTVRISASGGTLPRWRGDGRELFYMGLDGGLMSAKIDNGRVVSTELLTMMDWNTMRGYDVAPDGERFLFILSDATTNVPADRVVVGWNAGLD